MIAYPSPCTLDFLSYFLVLLVYLTFLFILVEIHFSKISLKLIESTVQTIDIALSSNMSIVRKQSFCEILIFWIDRVSFIIWKISVIYFLGVIYGVSESCVKMIFDSCLCWFYIMVMGGFVLEIEIFLWSFYWH